MAQYVTADGDAGHAAGITDRGNLKWGSLGRPERTSSPRCLSLLNILRSLPLPPCCHLGAQQGRRGAHPLNFNVPVNHEVVRCVIATTGQAGRDGQILFNIPFYKSEPGRERGTHNRL